MRWSNTPSVREAQPSSRSSETVASQPVTMSSISSPALAVSRAKLPGKVMAKTSSARIRQAPSKRPPKNETAAASVPIDTTGSTAACTRAPVPGWLCNRRDWALRLFSRVAGKANAG